MLAINPGSFPRPYHTVLLRSPKAVFLITLAVLFIFDCHLIQAAESPILAVPAVYAGEEREESGTVYRIILTLGTANQYTMHEEITLPNGKVSSWDVRGTWHQIRNGAFLQLAAKDSIRLLNIGSNGDLYLGIRLPAGKQETLLLRPQDSVPEVTAFLENIPFGKDRKIYTPEYFFEDVAGARWMITGFGPEIPSDPHEDLLPEDFQRVYVIEFIPVNANSEQQSGALDVFDGSRLLRGDYSLKDTKLTLRVSSNAIRFSAVISQTRSWRLIGEVLELWGEKNILATLEQKRQ